MARTRGIAWVYRMQVPFGSLTAVATSEQTFTASELRPNDDQRWRDLHAQLQQSEEARRKQFRFRNDPAAYLAALEAQLLE